MFRALLACGVALLASACSVWQPIRDGGSWTLYVKDGETIDAERFGRSIEPAFELVESRMGAFEGRVRLHAWEEPELERPTRGQRDARATTPPEGPSTGEMQVVPGIGPARVRAYHVKGGPLFFQSSGVFLGTSDVGTVVHELVHARFAEMNHRVPLWFEEGLACLYGDGALFAGAWHVDGLWCWALRELRDQVIPDAELERLLSLTAADDYDSRENLLVHFVGWSIVFDLAHDAPDEHWETWLERFESEAAQAGRSKAARARMKNTLRSATEKEWMRRLASEDPATRLATAKGAWKLRSTEVVDRMLDALERGNSAEARAGLALNVLLASRQTRMGRTRWNRVGNLVFPALRDVVLESAEETQALRVVERTMRRWDRSSARDSETALTTLGRFWEE